MHPFTARITLVALLLSIPTMLEARAKITIVNNDGAGEGFNDPTPAEPVGGNTGTTIGAQRLISFQRAADTWADILNSPVEIFVRSAFDPLTCSATSGTLGSAGSRQIFSNFANAPKSGVWYPEALANKYAGVDVNPGAAGSNGDDINARFNSSLGTSGCLPDSGWYYGLDGNAGSKTDLIAVLLHELGHGLGFQTFTDKATGAFTQGLPDIFALNLFDNDAGLRWEQMTEVQRSASAINDGKLVWIGPSVTRAVPLFLGGTPNLNVSSPASVAGNYVVGTASFGGALSVAGVTANLVLAEDPADTTGPSANDGCAPFTNASQIIGRFAMIDRGSCTFALKALNAQTAGAIGVVIVNNVEGAAPQMGGDGPTVTIPLVSLSDVDGGKLKAQLGSGVLATMLLDVTRRAGADVNGRIKMYAPNPLIGGSSVSHWDVSANPDLLMEPNINKGLKGVDLTENAFEDIGWFTTILLEAKKRVVLKTDRDGDRRIDPGDTLHYAVDVTNAGDVTLTSVRLDDTVDLSTTIVDGSLSTSLGTITASSQSLRADIGDLARSRTATIEFDVIVRSDISTAITRVANQATVSASNSPPVKSDDPATAATNDPTASDISNTPIRATKTAILIADSDDNGGLSRGETIRYTVTVTNFGTITALAASFRDTPDSNSTLVPGSVTTTLGTIVTGNTAGDTSMRIDLGDLASNETATIQFDVVANAGTPENVHAITNQGSVVSSNLATALTDDPSTSTIDDATRTPFAGQRRRAVSRN